MKKEFDRIISLMKNQNLNFQEVFDKRTELQLSAEAVNIVDNVKDMTSKYGHWNGE